MATPPKIPSPSITRSDIIDDFKAENGPFATIDPYEIDIWLKIARYIQSIYALLYINYTYHNSYTIKSMTEHPARCAARIYTDHVNNTTTVADPRIAIAASASLAFGAYAIREEIGRKVTSQTWLDLFGLSDENTKETRETFLSLQFEILHRESYDICHKERYEEALKHGVVMQKKSTFSRMSPSARRSVSPPRRSPRLSRSPPRRSPSRSSSRSPLRRTPSRRSPSLNTPLTQSPSPRRSKSRSRSPSPWSE